MPDFGRWTSNGGDPSLNDINRVDRFFDALGSKETAYSTDHAEAELAFLLADWRDDIRDAPVTAPVTTRDAATALRRWPHQPQAQPHVARPCRFRRRRGALHRWIRRGRAGLGSRVTAFYGMRTTLFGQEQVRDEQVTLASQRAAAGAAADRSGRLAAGAGQARRAQRHGAERRGAAGAEAGSDRAVEYVDVQGRSAGSGRHAATCRVSRCQSCPTRR